MKINLSRTFAIPILTATLALGGCAATKMLVSEWNNPGYASPSFKRIMVGGSAGQTSIRRNFEDEFVSQLRAAGVDAMPSYRYMPEHEDIDEAKLKLAARPAGAEAVIVTGAVSVEQKTEYGPSYYPSPSFGIFGAPVGAIWSAPYGAPSVYRYDVYTAETTLYDVTKNDVVWSGTMKTTQPDNMNTMIKSYVETVIKALAEKNLLGLRK